jgi:hypothetical protein
MARRIGGDLGRSAKDKEIWSGTSLAANLPLCAQGIAAQEAPPMKVTRSVVLAGFLCFAGALASADSIPITGTVYQGFDEFWGDFNISGPSLLLQQGTPDGLNYYGTCSVGAICKVSFNVGDAAGFCTFCLGFSGGSLGNKTAEFLEPSLRLTGSAFYSGGSNLNVPLTIAGTIVGYELIDCTGDVDCSLGPKVFTVHIFGHGTAQITLRDFETSGYVYGWSTNFTGTASTVPEPVSIVLTGTGLVGVWIKKKIVQTRQV